MEKKPSKKMDKGHEHTMQWRENPEDWEDAYLSLTRNANLRLHLYPLCQIFIQNIKVWKTKKGGTMADRGIMKWEKK